MPIIDTINIKGVDYDIHDRNALTIDDKGVANGIASLDENGQIPMSQLPSEVGGLSEYDSRADFPLVGEDGILYLAKDTNLIWRWDGNEYITISSDLELGETSTTAYRGDRGKIAYDHSQVTGNPHGTTKADLGLGNVTNNKSVAVDALQVLTPTEKETARINIGAGILADVRVNGTSVVDLNNIANIKSYVEITQAEYDALPNTKYSDNIMYCITDSQNGGIYLCALTQAEYDALPSSAKNSNNTIYFITDGGGSGGSGVSDVLVNGVSVVSNGIASVTVTDENVTREYVNPPYDQQSYYNVLLGDNTSGNGHVKMLGGAQHFTYTPYNNTLEISTSGGALTQMTPSKFTALNGRGGTYTNITSSDIQVHNQSYAITINHDDLVLTNNTWDGTNTSLKDTIAAISDTKVKQLSTSGGSVYGNYRVLLSKSDNDTEETDTVYKGQGLTYNPSSGVLSLVPNNNSGVVIRTEGEISIKTTVDNSSRYMTINGDDIELQGSKWDGTNTSLKDAIAAAKNTDIFVVNGSSFSSNNTSSNIASNWYKVFNFTDNTSDEDIGTLIYLDKSYNEILSYVNSGEKPVILNFNGIVYTECHTTVTSGGSNAIEFKTSLVDADIDAQNKLTGKVYYARISEPQS